MRGARGIVRPLIIAVAAVVVLAVGVWLIVGSPRPASQERPRTAGQAKEQAKDHKTEGGAHGEEDIVKLTDEQRQALGVKVEPVQARVPQARLSVTGTIVPNPDRTVVVAPRVQGRAVKVLARLGDTVDAGASLALVDSAEAADQFGELAQADSALALAQAKAEQEQRLYDAKLRVTETARQQPTAEAAMKELARVELGRAKQEYISALAKAELAQAEYERAKLLVERKVGARKELIRAEKELFSARSEIDAVAETIRLSARQDLLGAQTALEQARAQRDRIREKLRLLGFTDAALRETATAPDRRLVPLVAPFGGTVIERQITEGQLVDPSSTSFRLADLRTVWGAP